MPWRDQPGNVVPFRPRKTREEGEKKLLSVALLFLDYHRDIDAGKLTDAEIVMRGANLRRKFMTIGDEYDL